MIRDRKLHRDHSGDLAPDQAARKVAEARDMQGACGLATREHGQTQYAFTFLQRVQDLDHGGGPASP
jgi:hypothetical protein